MSIFIFDTINFVVYLSFLFTFYIQILFQLGTCMGTKLVVPDWLWFLRLLIIENQELHEQVICGMTFDWQMCLNEWKLKE